MQKRCLQRGEKRKKQKISYQEYYLKFMDLLSHYLCLEYVKKELFKLNNTEGTPQPLTYMNGQGIQRGTSSWKELMVNMHWKMSVVY